MANNERICWYPSVGAKGAMVVGTNRYLQGRAEGVEKIPRGSKKPLILV